MRPHCLYSPLWPAPSLPLASPLRVCIPFSARILPIYSATWRPQGVASGANNRRSRRVFFRQIAFYKKPHRLIIDILKTPRIFRLSGHDKTDAVFSQFPVLTAALLKEGFLPPEYALRPVLSGRKCFQNLFLHIYISSKLPAYSKSFPDFTAPIPSYPQPVEVFLFSFVRYRCPPFLILLLFLASAHLMFSLYIPSPRYC